MTAKDLWFEGIGFALIGASIASAGFGSRLRTKAEQLRDRLNLLRSMQVAFLQVDRNDWILEANDRAEELFRRQLPKPGVTRLKVNFRHLIETRLVETDNPDTSTAYVEITERDVGRMRARGEASSYYARLSDNYVSPGLQSKGEQNPRWLRISATPMMDVDEQETAANRVQLLSISAIAYEVPNEIAQELEKVIQHRSRVQSVGGSE